MDCPRCHRRTRVLESRRAERGAVLRRRRECGSCGHRFTTFERRERAPLQVRKRDGERQRFERTKLRAALIRAAHKRPVSAADLELLVDRIELEGEEAGGELAAERIAALCLEGLRDLDHGAYLQFAGTLPSTNADFAASAGAGSVRTTREPPWFPPRPTSEPTKRR